MRSSHKGNIGSVVWNSTMKNRMMKTRKTTMKLMSFAESHLQSFAFINPYVRQNIATKRVNMPNQSIFRSAEGSNDSLINGIVRQMTRIPIGTFTKKIASQPMESVRIPPKVGPLAAAKLGIAAQMPRIMTCFSFGNRSVAKGMVTGTTMPADKPCKTRKNIIASTEVDTPHRIEVTMKNNVPIRNRRLRPN